MATTWSKIREATLGKTFDIDGAYGGQCWDYVMYVMEKYYGGKRISCTTTKFAKDIANNRKTNGILNYCTDVGLKAILKPGDICVWTNCAVAPDSHIAIFDHDTNGKAYFCGQNQSGGQKVTVDQIDVFGIIGVFRPKKGLIDEDKLSNTSKPANLVDQVLDVGSKCKFAADYTVEKIDIPNQWVYNSRIGGWIGSAICREIKGGKKVDQCLTVGDHFTIDGTFTVSKIDIPNQKVYLKELGFWVLSESLTEVA